jgi:hypothetical protein
MRPSPLLNELQSVAARIARADPERADRPYETFIAACREKAKVSTKNMSDLDIGQNYDRHRRDSYRT